MPVQGRLHKRDLYVPSDHTTLEMCQAWQKLPWPVEPGD